MQSIFTSLLKGSRPSTFLPRATSCALLLVLLWATAPAQAQGTTTIRIDASQPAPEPSPARYDGGAAQSPTGSVIGLNSRYLTRDGQPWLPVMGEFHYSRVPRQQWEEELLKMKAAGINIVATYVIWIHHEEVEGQFDWTGQRDLRAFAQLCAKHGLLLEPRIGPWAHAEARNGGLPDWVMKNSPVRVNDPVYLAEVNRWYAAIGQQLKGLMWKDGGPVMAIQLENEYSAHGPGAGEEHILTLKKMAIENRLDVPLYFVTGWDNAAVPERAVIPIYGGGYPDAPWDGSIVKLPPAEVYAFRFQSRVAANMGAIGAAGAVSTPAASKDALPYLTAEIGGGIEDTYHRRPVIQPDDIGAMFPVMLGSGVNLYGTYMFHGGENPDGKLTTLQESQATGYPNDLPIKSYDFQAPIGEYGEERASLGKMKLYQYFLNAFGDELAPMTVHAPETQPANPADFSVPRAAVRSRGDASFIFLKNYARGYYLPARKAAQFEVSLPGGVVRVPKEPVVIPSGVYFIWPIHQQMGGVDLRSSTAQLFTRLTSAANEIYYFAAVRGIAPEFAFAARDLQSLRASSGKITTEAGVTYVSGIQPGVDAWINLVARDGRKTRVGLLTADEAESAWRVRLGGAERLLITNQDFFVADDGGIHLRSRGTNRFAFTLTPPLAHAPQSSLPLTRGEASAQAVSYHAQGRERELQAQVKVVRAAEQVAPVKLAPPPSWRANGVAQAPAEGELTQAGKWSITVPAGAMNGLDELYLRIRYEGDVARLYDGGKLLTDDFFNGLDWQVGLKRYLATKDAKTLELEILPLRQDAPVYFETPRKVAFGSSRQVGNVESVRLLPEYELVLGVPAR
jgi:hypothetical protein